LDRQPGAVFYPLSQSGYVLHFNAKRGIDGHWRKNNLITLLGRKVLNA
jgi:hypothetical protein